MKIATERLTLETISPALARRIISGDERDNDRWHSEYPLVDELDPLTALAAETSPHPVFTMYLIRRTSDGLAVGGLGFFGPPDVSGRVDFGYGLVPAARGVGLATEAVRAALATASAHGARLATADTNESNRASQRVLERAGMTETRREGGLVYFARDLATSTAE
jgi:RimJ/RimL family protein N-acetyltransferase